MSDRMPCGHPRDALVWDDDIKKEICGACRAEAASTSRISKAFASLCRYDDFIDFGEASTEEDEEQVPSEDTAAELLRKQITTWRAMNPSDPTRGLDELMGVVKQVYERDLAQMQNIEFLKHFQKYSEAQPDEDEFKRVGEATGANLAQRIEGYIAKQKLMAENALTVGQADILLHTLGHPKYYRNYFAVSGGTQDWRDITMLVKAGLMEEYQSRDHDSGLLYYRVTETGMDRMRAAGFTLAPPENECGEGADYVHVSP